MIVRFANVVYWLALAVSAALLLFVTASAIFGHGTDLLPVQVTLGIGAVLIGLAGRAVRYVFAGR